MINDFSVFCLNVSKVLSEVHKSPCVGLLCDECNMQSIEKAGFTNQNMITCANKTLCWLAVCVLFSAGTRNYNQSVQLPNTTTSCKFQAGNESTFILSCKLHNDANFSLRFVYSSTPLGLFYVSQKSNTRNSVNARTMTIHTLRWPTCIRVIPCQINAI